MHSAAVYVIEPKLTTLEKFTKQQNHRKDFPTTNLDFLQQIQQFCYSMDQYCMNNVFIIHNIDTANNYSTNNPPVDLLSNSSTITLD